MRRSSLIEAGTGQVVGYLYVGIVLNDNFALLEISAVAVTQKT